MTNNLKRGAILSCYFPMNEAPNEPGPQARPALVLGSFPNPSNPDETMVIVSYGTSVKTRAKPSFEIRIDTTEKMKDCGLHRETRFKLNRLRILPLTREYFEFTVKGRADIGNLSAPDSRVLSAYLDDLATHADELNFFRPKEALKSGKRFDPKMVDAYMQKELTGLQFLRRSPRPRKNMYRRA